MSQRKIRVVEWFGGIGAATQALKQMGQDHEVVDYVELDKFAVKSYNAINGTDFKPTDINDVDVNKYGEIDLLIAGWPCQDYSIQGKQLGTFNGQRSSLILVTIDKIREMVDKPKYILLENVPGLLQKPEELNQIKEWFNELGYKWSQVVLNSKHFNTPQTRERVFILLSKFTSRILSITDIADFKMPLVSIKEIMEKDVPYFYDTNLIRTNLITNNLSIYNGYKIWIKKDKMENQNPEIINEVAELGNIENGEWKPVGFRVKKNFIGIDGLAPTLRAGDCDNEVKLLWTDKSKLLKYRKITTLEAWRLMGFSYEAHKKAKEAQLSNSQLFKQAGNSIVVNCLIPIINRILFANDWKGWK